ncbi:sensor histidine kinase [Clostridium sp. 19966]|uniref:sensor histidine kinase n=1 Tax=Clostridium sp. 19966 TaxID=2768166 RepID=UPI0028DE3588|nr:sensor histidine kinase [Clostridium sp. 19966]MDT8716878.1 sensor histidine kinase [Clostridium sp. 19966]
MDILTSAKNRLFTLKVLSYLCIISMLYDLSALKDKNSIYFGIISIFIMEANNFFRSGFFLFPHSGEGRRYGRSKYVANSEIKYIASYFITTLILGYLSYGLRDSASYIYNVVLIIEIIASSKEINIFAFVLNFLVYAAAHFDKLLQNNLDNITSYAISAFIVFLFRNIVVEKSNIEKLNQELKEANLKLKQYSETIEELTIAKERTRIAQELHDSMGHSLIALKMNMEYCENIAESNPAKAKEIMIKTQAIIKECMNNLRKAVSLLKEERRIDILREAINELFQKFKEANTVRLILDIEEEAEKVNPDIKNSIYKTVREAVTNGIKHGDAEIFNIQIHLEKSKIILKIKNNGKPCDNMVKSNGIKGIEERIHALGGECSFKGEKEFPFILEAKIPAY